MSFSTPQLSVVIPDSPRLWQSKHDKSAKGRKSNIAGAKMAKVKSTCNIWFSTFCTLDILGSLTFGLLHLQYCCLLVLSTFCTLDILGSLTFGLLHLQYCCLIVLSCLDCHTRLSVSSLCSTSLRTAAVEWTFSLSRLKLLPLEVVTQCYPETSTHTALPRNNRSLVDPVPNDSLLSDAT